MKNLFLLIAVLLFTLECQSQSCVTLSNSLLKINNNRNCDITVNWEVSDCSNIPPNPTSYYCNSTAQTGSGIGLFVIAANSSYTVNISLQTYSINTGSDCSWYFSTMLPNSYDVEVNLFEIDYTPPASPYVLYGRVAAGCLYPINCFSVGQTASGDSSNLPAAPSSCPTTNNAWSMQWSATGPYGVVVDIN